MKLQEIRKKLTINIDNLLIKVHKNLEIVLSIKKIAGKTLSVILEMGTVQFSPLN